MITITINKQKLNNNVEKSKRIGNILLLGLKVSSNSLFECGRVVTKEIINELKQ